MLEIICFTNHYNKYSVFHSRESVLSYEVQITCHYFNVFLFRRDRSRGYRDNEDRYVNTAPPYDAKLRPSDKVKVHNKQNMRLKIIDIHQSSFLFLIYFIDISYSRFLCWLNRRWSIISPWRTMT